MKSKEQLKNLLDKHKNIMWIGAHPDDELSIAPALVDHTRKSNVKFTMINITNGEGYCLENGNRIIDSKCSAEYFGGSVINLGYKNLSKEEMKDKNEFDVMDDWGEKLHDDLKDVIIAINPSLIITFDPHIAFGGHIEHKALWPILYGAINSLLYNCKIWLSTSYPVWNDKQMSILASEDSSIIEYNKSYHAKNIYRIHSSCFKQETISKITDIQISGFNTIGVVK